MDEFLRDLAAIAPPAGQGAYAFVNPDGVCRGWVQLIIHTPALVEIHRLWTLQPRQGNGKMMLQAVCELADRHGIEIKLKALPFGRKPYPMQTQQLLAWYHRYGFAGKGRKLVRKPAPRTHDNRAASQSNRSTLIDVDGSGVASISASS